MRQTIKSILFKNSGLGIALLLMMTLFLSPSVALADSATTPSESSNTTDTNTTNEEFIFDEYGLFNNSQRAQLEAKAQELAETYDMGVYLLTCNSMESTSSGRTNFATNFYRKNNLGLGEGKDGILFVIAVVSRDYVTIAYGQGSYSFSDEGIEALEDAVKQYLSHNEWFSAAETYYDQVGSQLAFYEATGKPQKPLSLFDWIIRIAIILLIPAIIAFIIVIREKAAMKNAVQRDEASFYLDRSSLNVTVATDQFVNTTLIATPRVQSNGSGGSSGGWGGGGGGGFSSSGGGKF